MAATSGDGDDVIECEWAALVAVGAASVVSGDEALPVLGGDLRRVLRGHACTSVAFGGKGYFGVASYSMAPAIRLSLSLTYRFWLRMRSAGLSLRSLSWQAFDLHALGAVHGMGAFAVHASATPCTVGSRVGFGHG